MGSYDVTSPDGRKFRVNAPDGASQDEIIAYAQANMPAAPKPAGPEVNGPVQAFDIAVGRGFDRLASGLRSAVPESVRNAVDKTGAFLGMGAPPTIDAQELANNEAEFAKVEKAYPKATFAGGIAPYAAVANPVGMGILAATEVGTPEERASRGALAFAGGKAGEYVGSKVANALATRSANKAADLASQKAQNAVRDASLQAARDVGYVLPPSQVNPSIINRALEGFAGKLTTAQQASAKNQNVTNSLVRKSLGLADDAPLTRETMFALRNEATQNGYAPLKQFGEVRADTEYANKLYDMASKYDKSHGGFKSLQNAEIESLIREAQRESFDSNHLVGLMRNLREQGFANKGPTSTAAAKSLGKAQIELSDAIEALAERNLAASGQGQVLQNFRNARKLIAQSFTAEKAINEATGNVDANKIGAMFRKGKPLSGGMLDVGRAAAAFPAATKEVTTSMPGLSPLDYMGGLLAGGATGGPGAAAVFARPIVRSGILSNAYQNAMVGAPSYAPGLADRLISQASKNPEELRKLGGLLGLSALRPSP